MMYVRRYDITLKRGINRWEGPIAYLMIIQFLEINVHPLHVSYCRSSLRWLMYFLVAHHEQKQLHTTQTPHLQQKVFLHSNHVPGLGRMWNCVKTNMCQTKVAFLKHHKVRSPSFTWTKNQFSLQWTNIIFTRVTQQPLTTASAF